MKIKSTLLFLIVAFAANAFSQTKTKNIIVVTLDGLRWQEIFRGADSTIINSEFTPNKKEVNQLFWNDQTEKRRALLMPFLWSTVMQKGQLYGNRDLGNKEEVSNPYYFSYPGYNEIMTGFPDKRVNSNDKIYNPNINVLEFINQQKGYEGKVAAFSSWDVFPYILNDKRSGVLVNSGINDLKLENPQINMLNEMQHEMLSPVGDDVRPDVLTYQFAKQFMLDKHPKALYIAFDETDDYAHGGYYQFYLKQAHNEDKMLQDLWNTIQSDPFYKDQTTLLITCDHGRGDDSPKSWRSHGTEIPNSKQTWFAIMGPDTPARGIMPASSTIIYHNQFAQTIAKLLGLDFKSNTNHEVGDAINSVFSK
ncbi:MAG: alkaline phosphatase family protein [Bacteroidetes bacterium]|nr:alkaline phosphatase family protein [Bacteroidota bacterium]MBU1372620.1 alkaline phosphatase family protein [Bacteroidota bacterium]MBU1484816.1 alkaline phosphatase family protein [Bacteroidota bacterium]MBU1759969.1 alkaline phosphatase family protein [Bacteroidota bacterium]MBU2267748.1 alkaline phosphatase family protein [Bacteroidota bacterium]